MSTSEAAAPRKDDGGATSEDSEWRCSDCGRFALKRRTDGTKIVCGMCFAARRGYPPQLSPLKNRVKVKAGSAVEAGADSGTDGSDIGTDSPQQAQVQDGYDEVANGHASGKRESLVPDATVESARRPHKIRGEAMEVRGDDEVAAEVDLATTETENDGEAEVDPDFEEHAGNLNEEVEGDAEAKAGDKLKTSSDVEGGHETVAVARAEDAVAKLTPPLVLPPAATDARDSRPLRKRKATAQTEVRHPRLRLVMSGRRQSPSRPPTPPAVARKDAPRATTPRLAAKREAAQAAEAALANGVQTSLSKKRTDAASASTSSAGADPENLFPPGQVVWTGGRGYQGGLWDPWPGRIVSPHAVQSREFKNVVTSKRVIMLFGRQAEDRRFVVMSVAALRPYVADASNTKRKFRDPRGRFACCLANSCEDTFPSSFTGIIDEDMLRGKLSDEQLALEHETVACAAVGSTEYDLSLPGESLKQMRLAANASQKEPKYERGKRRAAVNNRFCLTPEEKTGVDCASTRAVLLPPVPQKRSHPIVAAPLYHDAPYETVAVPYSKPLSSDDDDEVLAMTGPPMARHRQKRKKEAADRSGRGGEPAEAVHPAKRSRRMSPEALAVVEKPASKAPTEEELDLSRLGVDDIAHLMTQFVTQGYPAKLRRAAADHIGSGCANYVLNGRALLAKQPSNETLAQAVFRDRKKGSQIIEDGTYYAVLEFITLARRQEQDLTGLRLKSRK